ncbi:MAG: class I SAM-dependent methyltransferase [candidate division Zixibacteria bacterium]|nr:class I SAM-dependent methyltransferase [candidate division Zixibacteria bacterium]
MKRNLSLAAKWNIVSELYHNDIELEAYVNFLADIGAKSILDCACGTGFPSLELAKHGFKVTASDNDFESLNILKSKMNNEKISFPIYHISWENLDVNKLENQFDAVICLGSSITYFDSWDENVRMLSSNHHSIIKYLQGFKKVTKKGGHVLIGICKLYKKSKDVDPIPFPPKRIDGLIYNMQWTLHYNWKSKEKTWNCLVASNSNSQEYEFSVRLISHLYDKSELIAYCEAVFNRVYAIDICPSPYHDIILVCET